MRILIVNYEYPPLGGGGGNASQYLAKNLVRTGHKVSVLTSSYQHYKGTSDEDNIRVHRVYAGRKRVDRSSVSQMLCFAIFGSLHISRVAKEDRIEQVIAYFTIPSGICAYVLKLRSGIPYVISLRGGDVPGFVPEINHLHGLLKWFRRMILRSASAITANSKGLAELSLRSDPFAISVIKNGVDSEVFSLATGALAADRNDEEPFKILFVGRLHSQKNIDLLLKQLVRLRRLGLKFYELHILGDGPLRSELMMLTSELDLDERVIWHGWVEKQELVRHYQNVHCLVCPSSFEGMSNTILEAMACGLAVVASDVAGNDELVRHEQTGMLFQLSTPNQLADSLMRLYESPQVRNRMGKAGRKRVVDKFSWGPIAASYVELLEKSS